MNILVEFYDKDGDLDHNAVVPNIETALSMQDDRLILFKELTDLPVSGTPDTE